LEQEDYQGMSVKDITLHIIGVIMAEQYIINKGLKLFGKDGEKAVLNSARDKSLGNQVISDL
jgi:hypothetical protein